MPKRKIRLLSSSSSEEAAAAPRTRTRQKHKQLIRDSSKSSEESPSPSRSPSPLIRKTDKKKEKSAVSKKVKLRRSRSPSPSPSARKSDDKKKRQRRAKTASSESESPKPAASPKKADKRKESADKQEKSSKSKSKPVKSTGPLTNGHKELPSVIDNSNRNGKMSKNKPKNSPPVAARMSIMHYFGKIAKKIDPGPDPDPEPEPEQPEISDGDDNEAIVEAEVAVVVAEVETTEEITIEVEQEVISIEESEEDDEESGEGEEEEDCEDVDAEADVDGDGDGGDESDEVTIIKEETRSKSKVSGSGSQKRSRVSGREKKSPKSVSKTMTKSKKFDKKQHPVSVPVPGSSRRSRRIADKSYRSIKSYFTSNKADDKSSDSADAEEFESPPRRTSKKKTLADRETAKKQTPVPPMDAKTREFLYSGLPTPILKVQKQVEKKHELDQWLETVQFFPKFSHCVSVNASVNASVSANVSDAPEEVLDPSGSTLTLTWPSYLNVRRAEAEEDSHVQKLTLGSESGSGSFKCNLMHMPDEVDEVEGQLDLDLVCCKSQIQPSPKLLSLISRLGSNINLRDSQPWIEKYKPNEQTLAVEPGAYEKFRSWMEAWKSDITENDGTIRRQAAGERKKPGRKNGGADSDSDFLASDDDDDDEYCYDDGSLVRRGDKESLRKKSVILYGPTGSGKTAMVYVVAKNLGFKVVEINFSSRRSGREIMEKVEEATLSQQLQLGEDATADSGSDGDKDSGTDKDLNSSTEGSEDDSDADNEKEPEPKSQDSSPSPHCLLLFEDIDLDHAEDDDGYYRAIVQLISASCRPIVMSITTPSSNSRPIVDPKIEKTDPLWIPISPLLPETVVSQVLLPILRTELDDYLLKTACSDTAYVSGICRSIATHSGSDIRSSIHTLQIYWSRPWFGDFDKIHRNLCTDGIPYGIIGQIPRPEVEVLEQEVVISASQTIVQLEQISIALNQLTDSDIISSTVLRLVEFQEGAGRSWSCLDLEINFMGQARSTSLVESGPRAALTAHVRQLTGQLCPYLDDASDYEGLGFIRTVVKQCVLNSRGVAMKRNGRMKHYFNRLSPELLELISGTFGFREVKKEAIANALLNGR